MLTCVMLSIQGGYRKIVWSCRLDGHGQLDVGRRSLRIDSMSGGKCDCARRRVASGLLRHALTRGIRRVHGTSTAAR